MVAAGTCFSIIDAAEEHGHPGGQYLVHFFHELLVDVEAGLDFEVRHPFDEALGTDTQVSRDLGELFVLHLVALKVDHYVNFAIEDDVHLIMTVTVLDNCVALLKVLIGQIFTNFKQVFAMDILLLEKAQVLDLLRNVKQVRIDSTFVRLSQKLDQIL